jgi:hypothetical protein
MACTCNPNSSGIHHYTCPERQVSAPSVGWTCPSCGRNNAPSIQVCSCSKVEDRGPQRQILTEGPRRASLTEIN